MRIENCKFRNIRLLYGKNREETSFSLGFTQKLFYSVIEPLMIDAASGRETIAAPTEAEMRRQLKEETEGIVFIH